MIISFLQTHPTYLEKEQNLDAVEAALDGLDADLLVLPELFATGYYFQGRGDLAAVAEPVRDGETVQRLEAWARRYGTTIVAGMPERAGERFYNSAVIVGPDGLVGTYRKVHLFFEEKLLFAPGDLGLPVFDVTTRDGVAYRLGVMICFDWYFPEAARSLALAGADVIAHPANLVRKDCPRAMPIRALENHVYTITANRYGAELKDGETLTFIGQSLICDPDGEVLAQAPREGDHLGTAEIDPLAARDRQITEHNHLFGDRRVETYAALWGTSEAI